MTVVDLVLERRPWVWWEMRETCLVDATVLVDGCQRRLLHFSYHRLSGPAFTRSSGHTMVDSDVEVSETLVFALFQRHLLPHRPRRHMWTMVQLMYKARNQRPLIKAQVQNRCDTNAIMTDARSLVNSVQGN